MEDWRNDGSNACFHSSNLPTFQFHVLAFQPYAILLSCGIG